MKRVLLLHGWGGSDYPHWQAKLAGKIACNYGKVSFPLLKHPHFPKRKDWLRQLDREIKEFKPNIVICHSLANILWLWYVIKSDYVVDRLYLVAMPSLNTKEHTIGSFFPAPLPNSLNAKEVTFVASTNDRWCSVEEIEQIAKRYRAKLKILENGGHINSESGYGDWEWMEQEMGIKRSCCR